MEIILKTKLDRFAINNLIDEIFLKKVKVIRNLDLTAVEFVDPYGMVLLLQLFDYVSSIEHIEYPDNAVVTYMARANFFSHAENFLKLDKKAKTLRYKFNKNPNNNTMLEITRIENKDDILNAVQYVDQQTRSILQSTLNYDDDDVLDFITLIVELLDNIRRHSNSSGYICAQVYRFPKSNRSYVSVCISDTGIGMTGSLNESPYVTVASLNDKRAIKMAVVEEVTSKSKGGIGYYGIKEKIKKFSGSLYVRSGDAEIFIDTKGNHSIKNRRSRFVGTQIEMRLHQK